MSMKLEKWAVIAGVLLLIKWTSSSGAKEKVKPRTPAPGSAREKWDPLGIRKRTAAAIATGDPATMRAFADAIRAEGYAREADELEAAAQAAEQKRRP